MLIIDAFVNALALRALGCKGIMPEAIGRPSYYPAILLKLYIYDYLSQVQSSRRLPPDADRDVLRWTIRSRPRTLQFVARRRPRPAADIISFQRAHVCRNASHQGDSSRSHTTIWAPAPEPGGAPGTLRTTKPEPSPYGIKNSRRRRTFDPHASEVIRGLKAPIRHDIRIRRSLQSRRIGLIILASALRILPDLEQEFQRHLILAGWANLPAARPT